MYKVVASTKLKKDLKPAIKRGLDIRKQAMHIVPVCTIPAEVSPQALPLGAASIVAAINCSFQSQPAQQEVSARLVSFPPTENRPEAIARQLLESTPAAICFSLFVWNRRVLAQAADIIRREAPEIPLIAGGPEVTSGAADKDSFHYLVCGEGDESVPELLRQLLSSDGAKKAGLPRKIFSPRANQEQLPSPYLTGVLDPAQYQDGALWELARGCPFKCAYCYESKGEKTVAYFPMERIRQELEFFAKKKVSQIFVLDPTYNAQKQRAVEILTLIRQKAPHTFFHFECRAELLDSELVRAFSKLACSLQIGLQSAHPEVLKLVARSINRKEFAQKIALLNQAGVVFGFDLIYGLPGDTLAGFKESIDYALSLYPNSLEIFRLSVLPGTTLFDQRQELGLVSPTEPPYLVESTPQFSAAHLDTAEELARATSYFYSRGRAVGWFHSLLKPLSCSPSAFFTRFTQFLAAEHIAIPAIQDACSHKEVEAVQVQFITSQYSTPKLKGMLAAATDLIRLNGAFSRAYADGETTRLQLSYHPEDLLSPYTQDLAYFCRHAQKKSLHVRVQPGKHGSEWRLG